ncbi:MAG: class I SAM-dependent methyltransferase [Myxococcota bacterium]
MADDPTSRDTLETNTASWDQHARRYQASAALSLDEVDFGDPLFPTESDLKVLGDVAGKRVVELGSGGCNCGIALAKQGARVTCLDISAEQLRIGRAHADAAGVHIETVEAGAHEVSRFGPAAFDLAIAIASLNYVPDLDEVFLRVFEALAPGGRFVFSVPHPFMNAFEASVLSPQDQADPHYGYRGPMRWKWDDDDAFEFVTYRRTIADLVGGVIRCGFRLDRFEELLPKRPEPEWNEVEHEVRTRFPSILVIAADKP